VLARWALLPDGSFAILLPYSISAIMPLSGGVLLLLPNGGIGYGMQVRSIRDLGAAVRGRRRDLGMTQAELALQAGVSRKWVYEFEAGKPTAELRLILRALDALELVLELGEDDGARAPAASTPADLDKLIEEHRAR
jgi:y4mF family transcriptional regulator